MQTSDRFSIQLLFDQRSDGRVHVHSPTVPGLHLAGYDVAAIKDDIEPMLKDILLNNSKIVIDEIEWIPSLDALLDQINPTPTPPSGKKLKPETLIVSGRAA